MKWIRLLHKVINKAEKFHLEKTLQPLVPINVELNL